MSSSRTAASRHILFGAVAGLALGAAGAAFAADVATDADAASSREVEQVDVYGHKDRGLAKDTGLAVMPYTVQDTPQAINVVPAEQLRQQNVATLDQALRNVPGITVAIGEGGTLSGDQFKIRGQNAQDDIYVDGLRDFGVYTRDSFDTHEVQVLKGPSGAMFGRGSVGGVVNSISKMPMLKEEAEAYGSVGNGDYYRATADLNHQIGPNAAIRVNLMANSNNVVDRDLVGSDRWGVAIAAGFGLETDTSLTFNYLHQHDNRTPDYGIIMVQKPGQLIALPASEFGVPRSTYLGFDTDEDRTTADIFTAKFRKEFNDNLTLTSDSRAGVYHRYFQYTTVDRCDATAATNFCAVKFFGPDPQSAEGGIGGGGPYDQNAWGAQNITALRAKFDIGGMHNDFIFGSDLSYQSNDKTFYAYRLPPGFTYTLGSGTVSRSNIGRNLFDPIHSPPPGYEVYLPSPGDLTNSSATATTVLTSNGTSADYGVFATDRLYFNDHWSVIGSLRYDRYVSDFTTTTVAGVTTPLSADSNLWNPRASLVYEPSASQTFYLSWGRSANPIGTSVVGSGAAIALTSKDLQPEKSETFEAGAKVGFFGNRLSLTGSVFDVKKNNAVQTDPATGFVQAQSGERQEIKGVELGAIGRLTHAWAINLNYTYLDADIKESYLTCSAPPSPLPSTAPTNVVCPAGTPTGTAVPNTFAVGRQVTFTPKHAASLWTTYDLSEAVPGLTIGGGVTYQSKLYLSYAMASASYATPGVIAPSKLSEAPSNLQFDGFIGYQTGRYSISLNGYNLTDRLNYSQVFSSRAVPAAGRTVVLTLGASF
jgi:catecholate siderophore receptor